MITALLFFAALVLFFLLLMGAWIVLTETESPFAWFAYIVFIMIPGVTIFIGLLLATTERLFQ